MATPEGSRLDAQDLHLFNEGTHLRLWERLGAHVATVGGVEGTVFAVWAPNAEGVSVVGDFNDWDGTRDRLFVRGQSGIWEGFVPGVQRGALYKYEVHQKDGARQLKADPCGVYTEEPPRSASRVWDLDYAWGDGDWMEARRRQDILREPMSIYEVHLASWRRVPEEHERTLSYRELAEPLAEHVKALGFTHVELMPVMEHPFSGSWGYQVTGYFAPTARHGSPQDLMYLIDQLHQEGIGVILDWVPAHFPSDGHGLATFDGTCLYEHQDPRKGYHPDWRSHIFNYGRHEVRGFLISNALYWLEMFHADGLRVDGVASMLYLDYSRGAEEWIPNEDGGRDNKEAIGFIREMNAAIYKHQQGAHTIAEESTAWPMVSRPAHVGGLGFGLKWDMGWMHDTLRYLERDPLYRRYHHGEITFRALYAFNENFVLPLSHDEVVHGKGSLLNKMPGDRWQKFATLRLLYAYMYGQPGKKLLFMGSEIAQWREWNHESSLDWHLLEHAPHAGVAKLVGDLNRVYRDHPAMHRFDTEPQGFRWVDGSDNEQSVVTFLREGGDGVPPVLCVFNFTPVVRHDYRVGVPVAGAWTEILNTDADAYGGSGVGNFGKVEGVAEPSHGFMCSASLTLPPLAAVLFEGPPSAKVRDEESS
jgi:1,4-alpha-glucan branching enzyme